MVRERAAFVFFQHAMARRALERGDVRGARTALRALRSADFADRDAAEVAFAVLRDVRSMDDEIIAAVRELLALTPHGR